MAQRALTCMFGVICISLTPCTLCRADPVHVDTGIIGALAAQRDSRLNSPVTVSSRNTPLKAILDQIAAQTGISMTIDGRKPASGYAIMAECHGVPAWRMMDALYGLLSIRRGE